MDLKLMLLCPKHRRQRVSLLLILLGFLIAIALPCIAVPSLATPQPTAVMSGGQVLQTEQRGNELYQAGEFAAAAAAWEEAAQSYDYQGDGLAEARVLSNLVLAYQALGNWPRAQQALTDSRQRLNQQSGDQPAVQRVFAQMLNTQGGLQLSLGQAENALESWQQAATVYGQIGDQDGVLRSQINQAHALYSLGFYRRTQETLDPIAVQLDSQPASSLKVVTLRRLGNVLRLLGNHQQAETILEESLAVAQALQSDEEIGATLLSLGNNALTQEQYPAALEYYQQAKGIPTSPQTTALIQLAELRTRIEVGQWYIVEALGEQIKDQLDQLPPNRTVIYGYVSLGRSLMRLNKAYATLGAEIAQAPNWQPPAQFLARAAQQAQAIGDRRAESYVLGTLGNIYEETQQWRDAQGITNQALRISQSINAADIVYQWQWQLGRILRKQAKIEPAIDAYSKAIETLSTLRGDLVAIDSDIQFSFRNNVEPVYREFVDLLLQPDQAISQARLSKARDVVESLQLAELDNFFKEACLDVKPIDIESIDQQAAIFYPVILGNRLDVILRLPQQPLQYYSTPLPQERLEFIIEEFRKRLVIRSRREYLPLGQQLYDWIVRPLEPQLKASDVKTLAFVLDGALKNIPMAALHDGEHFLVEDYGIALTPGLKLLDPKPLPRRDLKVLAAGISEGRGGFAPLSYVASEIEAIETAVAGGKTLLNQAFTRDALKTELQETAFPIIHIATHGQFSSRSEETFILAWDDRINVTELHRTLQGQPAQEKDPIELLVLSACETAASDKRAGLGLAGTAVRAGARSTLATLWSVNDEATSELIDQFYQQLDQPNTTRAEALRQAQLSLLKNRKYRHPIYWSAYVLLGNWL
ncbi:MAG: CHAT domain-containing protein [Cyanobacteria bacterium P01_G01_bin.38]